MRVEDEIIDNDFRIFRYRQRRLVGKQQLRLAAIAGADFFVVDNVVAHEELALLALGHLSGDVGVYLGSDADLVLLGQSGPAQARDPKGRKNNAV